MYIFLNLHLIKILLFFKKQSINNSILISTEKIIASAIKTLQSESNSIAKLIDFIDVTFAQAVLEIFNSKGRLVVTGIGKSAIIAQKLVASFNSTGTPSLFLHASEAIHGDLGMIQEHDIIICISKSGNSPEIKVLVPLLKRFGNKVIAITGNIDSFLGKEAHFTLNTFVESESCPNNLAPTNSTTAQLVMGDAIVVCLMELKNFTSIDFAKFHPGGALGKSLLLRVGDMLDASQKPMVSTRSSIKDVITEISEKRLGVTAVIENEKIVGIITDGDIRRMLNKTDTIASILAKDIMTTNAKTIKSTDFVRDARAVMEEFSITQLVVADEGVYKGILHLHDILKEGIV